MSRFIILALLILVALPVRAENMLVNELALIERWLDGQRAYDRVPALSAAVVHDQELLWSGASGYTDLDSRQPARPDTIYGICSISKLFTGIAAMQLRDQGKLSLDDRVSGLLRWFELQQAHEGSPEITVRGMLTHSSGLPRESDTPYWMGPDFPFPTRGEVRAILKGQSTLYPADRYYQYSNLGLSLIGEIVAEKSGQGYEEYVRQHILAPLGLDDTDTGFPTDERESRIATGYAFPDREGVIRALPRYDARGITPAAGFASTALDLVRFASWQFRVRSGASDEVLQPNTLREMQRVHWMDWDWETSWGLAFGIYRLDDRTLTGHGGSCPGFRTRLFLDPLSRNAVAVMSNRNGANVWGYARVIMDILEAGGDQADGEAESGADTADFSEYIGSYDLTPWGGENLVFRWQEALAIVSLPTMDPLGNLVRMRHVEGDLFRTVRSDEEPGHEILFRRNEAGEIVDLVAHSNDTPRMPE
jgi:CubicO group peptidase (beta-lactamase class C family)